MKEQVKGILFDFKDAGWSVQKVEQELKFSNGSLGKVVNDVAGISEHRFSKLLELHQRILKKEPTVTNKLAEQIAENNLPDNKRKIESERSVFVLDWCEKCIQMTNHLNGKCQKCKIPPMPTKNKGEDSFDFAARKNEWKLKYNQ